MYCNRLGPEHDINSMKSRTETVLVLAGKELHFFTVAYGVIFWICAENSVNYTRML